MIQQKDGLPGFSITGTGMIGGNIVFHKYSKRCRVSSLFFLTSVENVLEILGFSSSVTEKVDKLLLCIQILKN